MMQQLTGRQGRYAEIAEEQLKAFREALARARKRTGLSQEAIGHQIGVTGRAVGHIESGRGIPRVTTVLALMAFFRETYGIILELETIG